jgi:DNA-binding MarR family transcriptional regulator
MKTAEQTRDLSLQLRDLMNVVRLLKQQREGVGPGMPTGMVGILMIIEQLGGSDENGCQGCHAKELAHRAGLDQSTVSRWVAALVNQGLVDRLPDPADKRASILAVTPAGRQVLAEAQDWFEGVLTRALGQWRKDEIDVLTASLGRFVTDLDGELRNDKLGNDKNILENAR